MKKQSLTAESELEALNLLTVKTASGDKPTATTENICRILRKHPTYSGRFRFDDWRQSFEMRIANDVDDYQPFEDVHIIDLQSQLANDFEFLRKITKDPVFDAILKVSKENTYDSAKDYISSLEWDKTDRISSWLTHTYGTPDDAYHRAVGSNWLKGLVKRIVHPGCKFDYVLVLEGEQGSKKSTSLAILGEAWHVETTMSTDNKDFFMQFGGKAIIEFSEGETLNRTEVKRMKAIISTQVDTYRPPYGRVSRDFPRRCVFAMTTNQEEYLKDETGNRRWLPVRLELPEANVEWLEANREQLLAEAYHRVNKIKETVYEFPKEETRAAQAARRVLDPNEDAVIDWYNTLTQAEKDAGVTTDQVAKAALHSGFSGPISRFEQISAGNVLRELLGLEKRKVMIDGIRRYRYYPADPLKDMEIKIKEDEFAAF